MRQYSGAPVTICAVARVGVERRQVAGLSSQGMMIWDEGIESPSAQVLLTGSSHDHVRLHASPDGGWLAATGNQHLNVWRYTKGVWREHLHEVDDALCAARFVGDALVTLTLADGVDWVLTRRELGAKPSKPGKRIAKFSARPSLVSSPSAVHAGHYWAADLSPDSRWVVLSAREKAIHLWSVEAGQPVGTVKLRGTPNEAAFSPDGLRFAVDGGTTVYIHDTVSLGLVATWRVPHCYVPQLAWSPDGRWLARADLSTAVRKFNVAGNCEGAALGVPRQRARSVAFSEDGSTYLVGTVRGSVLVWDFDE